MVCVWLFSLGCGGPAGPPYSPREALETFVLHDGFEIERFLSEPDVADPIAMDIDERGRIWVLENSGYPLEVEGRRGRVKLILDDDSDGDPDRTFLFADSLVMPTGIMAWKNGVIVVDPPEVLYLEDTDGDHRADLRKTLLTGFAFTNPQHTVSTPVYGLDNWIYLSHEGAVGATIFEDQFGDRGAEIHFPDKPDGPRLPVLRRSVRFRPDTHQLEYLAAPTQFGQAFDEWGALFVHNNSNHARHVVLAARYIERNPRLRLPQPFHDMYVEGNPAPVYPITENPRFEILSGVGMMTSASGLTRYLGGSFPGFEKAAFVAESTHNLVHADFWERDGATFSARGVEPGREFLASRDAWFRPVNFFIGPDGSLFVIDYYRETIEHPEWMAADVYDSEILYHGDDLGRIYRIRSKSAPPGRSLAPLEAASDAELVEALESPNIWRRRTAQRLLVDRDSAAAVPLLERTARESESAVGRVHALWTLDGVGKLDAALIAGALEDAEAGVRKNAIILAESRLADHPELGDGVLALEGDPDPHVRFQVLATLGWIDAAPARAASRRMLFADIEEEWMQAAALSRAGIDPVSLLEEAARTLGAKETPARATLFERLGAMIAAGGERREIARALSTVARAGGAEDGSWRQVAVLKGLTESARGMRARQAFGATERARLSALFASEDRSLRRAALDLLAAVGVGVTSAPVMRRAYALALKRISDASVDADLRADSLDLVALIDPAPHADTIRGLIDARQPEAVQAAAVRAYAKVDSDQVAPFLLENWRAMTGPVRYEAAEAMYRDDERIRLFVAALENGVVQPWMLVFRQKRRLIMHRDPALRARARELLTRPDEERKAVVETYQAALGRPGDPARGKQVFDRVCKKCHALRGVGEEVGPDLATVSSRPAQLLLNDILMPSLSIAQTYESYVVETVDGRILEGVIGPQSPTFLTLRREEGEQDVIERSEIKEMRATQLSAMPEDVETEVSVQEMADLLRYIKSAR